MSQESADRDLAASAPAIPQTAYPSAEPSWPNRYIWPVVLGILEENPTTGRQVFEIGSGNGGTAYDDLAGTYGTFPIVISLEVIEHCFSIKAYLETMFRLIEPGGLGIVSTPFHGYWKNLALSLADKWDTHHDPLWEGGHIKFFSEKTLTRALENAGFTNIGFRRAGRIPVVAKSTIAVFRRPAA